MIGQTISHYKILEKLGEGGMGIVYKAHDNKLDRDVALKFLPRDLSPSEEERARFIHEAKAASALDHPNICTIYEVDETSEGQMFIVMGYYEGRSISKMVEKGRLDVAEAVSIAIQITEGLQAAHEKGIVHRDIKSSNIIVSDKGQIRILDFGLARRKGLSKLTKTGTTIGTASYMSPEQAQGESIDQRTDIWSLGVVLYEMVTGRLPFRGEHEAAILYSVVNEQPQPIETSVAGASPELIHIINRALEKDPAERYKTAEDMLIDLRRLKKETSRTGFPRVTGVRRKAASVRNTVMLTAGVVVVLALVGYLLFVKRGAAVNADYSFRWINVPSNTLGEGLAVTPDGKWVIYGAPDKNGRWDLWVAGIGGDAPRRVTQDSSDEVAGPSISPDGTTIVYNKIVRGSFDICTVSLNGGISKKIGVGNQPCWSPDGSRIGYVLDPTEIAAQPYQPSERAKSKSGNGEFWTVKKDGSGAALGFSDSVAAKSNSYLFYAWSPDGRSVAWCHRAVRNGQESGEILIHDLATHRERIIVPKHAYATPFCWAANDQIIYAVRIREERSLWTVPADGGTPVQITKGLGTAVAPAMSADGKTFVFIQNKHVGHIWLAKLDGSGSRREVKVDGEPWFWCPSISPDGQYITVVIQSLGGAPNYQVYILRRDGTDIHQITTGEESHWWPGWSPDGKHIFYYARAFADEYKSFKVYVANVPKFDAPRLVSDGAPASWADSATLEIGYQNKMWKFPIDGGPPKKFADDSIWAQTVCNGKYVLFQDQHQDAVRRDYRPSWCRAEDWDGVGPKNATRIPQAEYIDNYGALYQLIGSNLYRISLPQWKIQRLNVNLQGIDSVWSSGISTTRDGTEMVYSSVDDFNKIGVIEDLFK